MAGLRRVVRAVVVALVALVALVATAAPSVPSLAPTPVGAAGQRYLDRVFADVTVTSDITYGAAPDETGATQSLELDLYEPAGDPMAARPLVVLVHGGSWNSGSKASMRVLGAAYARRGFVAASVEYRIEEGSVAIGYPPPAAEADRVLAGKHDVQAAVRWLRANAATHRIDSTRIAVSGISAGGVTAILVATTADDPGTSGTPGVSSSVCTAVSVMGAGDPAHVDPGDAGAFLLHGELDRVVPYERAAETTWALATSGLPARLVTVPDAGHGLFDPNLIEQPASEWMKAQVVDRTDGCAPGAAADASFVRAAYQDLLRRPPSARERAAELRRLHTGSRATVLGRLTTSDAWLGAITTGLYADTLGRTPDAAGLAYWIEALRSRRLSVARVATSFLAAAEYHARSGGTDAAWVAALYRQVLGRNATADEAGYWVRQVGLTSRSSVAGRIHGSVESRRTRVADLYAHLLGRAPEPSGLAYWADRVGRDGDLALARDLAASAEYGRRAVARYP